MATEQSTPQAKHAAIEALRKKKSQLEERIKQLEQKATAQRRKADTRLKVLLGAAFLADLPHHPASRDLVKQIVARGNWQKSDAEFLMTTGWLDSLPRAPTPRRSDRTSR